MSRLVVGVVVLLARMEVGAGVETIRQFRGCISSGDGERLVGVNCHRVARAGKQRIRSPNMT